MLGGGLFRWLSRGEERRVMMAKTVMNTDRMGWSIDTLDGSINHMTRRPELQSNNSAREVPSVLTAHKLHWSSWIMTSDTRERQRWGRDAGTAACG